MVIVNAAAVVSLSVRVPGCYVVIPWQLVDILGGVIGLTRDDNHTTVYWFCIPVTVSPMSMLSSSQQSLLPTPWQTPAGFHSSMFAALW